MKRSTRLLSLALASGLAVAACGGTPGADPTTSSGDDALSQDINTLLTDTQLEGDADLTPDAVQALLESDGSYLATYTDPTTQQAASTIIVNESVAQRISPIYMLARIEGESSLVTGGKAATLGTATGCACPDGARCARASSGFAKQITCAAELMRSYLDGLDQNGETVSAWKVGRARSTLDPCSVKPANRATAALYTYTPWVGKFGKSCGRRDMGGSTTIPYFYARFRGELGR